MKLAGITILGLISGIILGNLTGSILVFFLAMLITVIATAVIAIRDDKILKKAREDRLRQLDDLQLAYSDSINELKSNPTSADLKQRTLELGRKYSNLTRKLEGLGSVTIFDEVALMNDINAACAGAANTFTRSEDSATVENRLGKLLELKKKNLISEAEYSERRQKILDNI